LIATSSAEESFDEEFKTVRLYEMKTLETTILTRPVTCDDVALVHFDVNILLEKFRWAKNSKSFPKESARNPLELDVSPYPGTFLS
jgi:hypothetical protein